MSKFDIAERLAPQDGLVADEIAELKRSLLGEMDRANASIHATVNASEALARTARGSRPMMKAIVDAGSGDYAKEARAAAAGRRPSDMPSDLTDKFKALRG